MSERGPHTGAADGADQPPGTPRWVKVAGLVAFAVVVLFVVLRLTGLGGDHGPARHLSPGALPFSGVGAAAPDGAGG